MTHKSKHKYAFLISAFLIATLSSCGDSGSSTNNSTSGTASGNPGIETGVETGTTPPIQTSISFDINTDIPFPSDNPWNQDISSSPLDPNSAMYINALGTTQTLHPAFGTVWDGAPNGQAFVVVSGTQKKVPMSFYYQSDPGPYPIPADAPIQGGPNSIGDRHVIVIDKDNGLLYEIWDAHPDGSGGWNAGSGAIFNLHSNGLRPAGWTSADAAGLPIYPGLIRYQEVSVQKVIRHAIRFTADRTTSGYVYPARHFAGISDPTLPPMGMRVRLKANYDISGFSPNNKVILTAMKKYGMILADNGVSWQFSGEPSPNWDDNELHDLRRVPGSAFEVVEMGAIQR